ncbi:LysM peptidoglycan-binding domain-containing protein [Agathobaculum sp. NTUH-O15-33]|uniref:LysM peptidoglycan-binding domain-containing protein n=1 Tax=Agathobaculum sp. NTUH-O15-33 TaxID=3079302 RepID=UPI0029588291|nr:LysM peptidoglycan-binding domain-containing protein [Agathobaculum sp. NTUH-O15-33]WNX85792.1 LysM peptidoglycan-binding domain-containing protein [Agathobaculum sp. NTUH-O15-33]
MAKRRIIFVNLTTGQEIVMPVTPQKYEITLSADMQTVSLLGFGDVNLAGERKLFATTLGPFLLPTQAYQFNDPTAVLNPYYYISFFELAKDNKQALRLIVSDTPTQYEVLIEDALFAEQDGTNDLYLTLKVRQYRQPQPMTVCGGQKEAAKAVIAAPARATATPQQTDVRSHTVGPGDTLSGICRTYYGNANLYPKLATYNGIKNPDLIYDGSTIKIPPAGAL